MTQLGQLFQSKNIKFPFFPSKDLLLISCDMTGVQDIIQTFPDAMPVVYDPDDSLETITNRIVNLHVSNHVHIFADFTNNFTFSRSSGEEETLLMEWATLLKQKYGTQEIILYNRPIDCIGLDVFNAYCARVTEKTRVAVSKSDYHPMYSPYPKYDTIVLINQETPSDLILGSMTVDGFKVLINSKYDYGVKYMLQKIRLELLGSVMPDPYHTNALGIKYIDILPSTPLFTEVQETAEALKNEFGPNIEVRIKKKMVLIPR